MDFIGFDLGKEVRIITEDGKLIERRIETDKRDARTFCEASRAPDAI
ncbi:MAG TPA: hypothetical protein VF544_04850 [Pyrinomonadaceae bacterium]|jgi:hypothetical protein